MLHTSKYTKRVFRCQSHALYLVSMEPLALNQHIGFYGIHDRPIIAHYDAYSTSTVSCLKAVIGETRFTIICEVFGIMHV
jgi:hypothetical protein